MKEVREYLNSTSGVLDCESDSWGRITDIIINMKENGELVKSPPEDLVRKYLFDLVQNPRENKAVKFIKRKLFKPNKHEELRDKYVQLEHRVDLINETHSDYLISPTLLAIDLGKSLGKEYWKEMPKEFADLSLELNDKGLFNYHKILTVAKTILSMYNSAFPKEKKFTQDLMKRIILKPITETSNTIEIEKLLYSADKDSLTRIVELNYS